MEDKNRLLEVDDLKTYFHDDDVLIKAVDGISFAVNKGETLGVVGESGCGKSVTSLSIMQLLPQPKGRIEGGQIIYHKKEDLVNITSLKPNSKEMRKIRGNEIAMIFQEPMTSLNPVYTIGSQIIEAVCLHQQVDKKEARKKAIKMIDMVGIPAPAKRVDEYSFELSGGMRQRAMIAMALSCTPSFLIADEPTTALDVTVEAQILDLLQDLQKEYSMSIMFITHDLDVIGEMADRVIVMYTGKIVERATVEDIFYNPKHPYTRNLLNSIPKIGKKGRLASIKGTVPDLTELPKGCYFAPRCPEVKDICKVKQPPFIKFGEEHTVMCWLYDKEGSDNNE